MSLNPTACMLHFCFLIGNRIISLVKPTRCTSHIYFILEQHSLHVSDGLSVNHQESKTVHTASGTCSTDIPKMGTVTSDCIYVQW